MKVLNYKNEIRKGKTVRDMEDKIEEAIKGWIERMIQNQEELEKKYPSNLPNSVGENAYIQGIMIENSFHPKVGEVNELFETEYEKIYVWTHDKNEYSAIITKVDPAVKKLNFWKTIGSVLWMVIQYSTFFEGFSEEWYKYRWIYYFNAEKSLSEQKFSNLNQLDKVGIKRGIVEKATDISELAPIIELLLRDDKAYTALMLLCNSFLQHRICLDCELSDHPYHDHLAEEPEIWEHPSEISSMEIAIIQACRSVEGILGQLPSSKNKSAILKHKQKWVSLTGIEPGSIFQKANMSYMDFYVKLFYDLRNPSAHSYGKIHYTLEKSRTVQAQCFAAIIVSNYLHKQALPLEDAQRVLNFNMDFLERVNETMSTKLTK